MDWLCFLLLQSQSSPHLYRGRYNRKINEFQPAVGGLCSWMVAEAFRGVRCSEPASPPWPHWAPAKGCDCQTYEKTRKKTVRSRGVHTVVLYEPCLHCAWWGVKLLIWEIKHEAFHSATGDAAAVQCRRAFFFNKSSNIWANRWEDILLRC